ncbi:MAG TPA: hypothetical protein VHF26_22115 [Trebonia sp.]|nr:hypothetical protein [Trebonia sp.]
MSSPHQYHFPPGISRLRGTAAFTARREVRIALSITAIVAIAVAATVTVRLLAAAPAQPHAARSPAQPASRQSRAAAAPPAPAVPSSEGDARQPSAAPAPDLSGLRWVSYQGGYEVPVSDSAGPRSAMARLASGFADTPAGALVAAANIVTRTAWQMGPDVFGPTIEKQVTGPDAMALLQNDTATYDQDSSQIPEISAYPQLIAYAPVAYTPGDAVFALVAGVTGPGGAALYDVSTAEVRWIDGDWRLVAPADGTWTGSYIPSPDGYTLFPGRRQ